MEELTKILENSNPSNPNEKGNSSDAFPVPCGKLYDKFGECLVPGNQWDYIHRHGIAENCAEYFSDMTACFTSKLIKDPSRVREKYETTYHFAKEKSKVVNDILKYKEKPSWD